MGNRITPYKGREIDYSLPVYVYRNLNSKKLSYSIRQKGLVVGHGDALTLHNAEFIVNKKGQDRVVREKRKNVHAFIKAYISLKGVMGTDALYEETAKGDFPLPAQIKYNPYLGIGFYCDNLVDRRLEIKEAWGVIINKKGVFASYTS